MVKRELTMHEFEAIKDSLAASLARRKEIGGASELGTDNTVAAAENWGRSDAAAIAVEEDLLKMLGEGTLYIEMDE